MLRWFLHRKLDGQEKLLGESMDYLRFVLDRSPAKFLRFASIMPFANSRRRLPAEAWYVAQIVAMKREDCGPCLQITVNLAAQDNVDRQLLRNVLAADYNVLTQELKDVADFTESVVTSMDDDELRGRVLQHYGEQGLIEMSYAIASSRIPPTVKRTLGFAKSCKLVSVEVPA